jgi:prepilin-type N-terminal cleavage/methylation domain-containing protein
MKTELKAKFLQHLNQKKQDEGFTLIELLVVIIIIGILAAIALPSFLSQANKAKQSEAKQYVGSMNRTQQANYLEKSQFTTQLSSLGLGIKTQTVNYTYKITPVGDLKSGVYNQGIVLGDKAPLKSYVGLVGTGVSDPQTKEAATFGVLCESKDTVLAGGPKGDAPAAAGSFDATNGPSCNGNTYIDIK